MPHSTIPALSKIGLLTSLDIVLSSFILAASVSLSYVHYFILTCQHRIVRFMQTWLCRPKADITPDKLPIIVNYH
jgi:hypothetical protein